MKYSAMEMKTLEGSLRIKPGCGKARFVPQRLLTLTTVIYLSVAHLPSSEAQELFAPSAFQTCPSKAFLTQGTLPSTYSVNLITGDYNAIAVDHGTDRPLNAVGFNSNDGFMYAWSYEYNQPARIHNDWQIEPLSGVNITDSNYFVGDVSIVQNKYFVYRKGAGYGLYSIGLDPTATDYLQMVKVVDGSQLFLSVYDLAFHPFDDYAYTVDSKGILYRVSPVDGSYSNLGSIGVAGTFGASYFDPDGNLYLGRNNDGAVYRIAIDSGVYEAELFTIGPAASTNDGARCALAPLSDDTDNSIDFGDAPDSYGTSLANNGARHGLLNNPALYLGNSVDGESDSSFFPLSDDGNTEVNDEDGVQFVTSIIERETAIAMVTASAPGYLSAWIDLNRNGQFDTFEQVVTDKLTIAGQQPVYIAIPTGVSAGQSWARFRLSSTPGLPATGGTTDGEVEDMQVELQQKESVVVSYPSPTSWTTVAFEDNWPFFGDYDMNDLVVYLRNTTYSTDLGISRVVIEGEVAAVGASYHNGFGIRLPGVLRSEVDLDNLEFTINGQRVTDIVPLEENRQEAILIVAEDLFDFVSPGEACDYYRTQAGCGSQIEMSFTISVPMKSPVDVELEGVFDPFMFATNGKWHGPQFADMPGRSYEIHLKNQSPTEAFNPLLFAGIGQDVSSPSNGIYFQSAGGLPWAIEIGDRWTYPVEYSEISRAYPQFQSYAESDGSSNPHWYDPDTAVEEHLFKE